MFVNISIAYCVLFDDNVILHKISEFVYLLRQATIDIPSDFKKMIYNI